jgi:hypothetical protein
VNLNEADWNKRPEVDYPEVSKDYPLATVLPHKTVSLHRFCWHRVMAVIGWIVIIAASIACMQASGCFDKIQH